eukprot:3857959-Alexandrium_andersonii.AAC.1
MRREAHGAEREHRWSMAPVRKQDLKCPCGGGSDLALGGRGQRQPACVAMLFSFGIGWYPEVG